MQRTLAIFVLVLPACFSSDDSFTPNPSLPPPVGGGGGGGEEPDPDPVTLPLEFSGIQPVNPGFPDQTFINNHIAVGGTHEVTLKLDSDLSELTTAYDADTIDPSLLAIEEVDGPHIRLHALAQGLDSLVITDPRTGKLFDYGLYAMSPFARAVAVGVEEGVTSSTLFGPPAQRYVFAPGRRRIGVAYLNAGAGANRLVDTSATLSATGATQTRFDEITFDAATVGTHTIAVTVGGVETTVEFEVIDAADTIQKLDVFPGVTCFGAFVNGAFLSGAAWTMEIDGQPYVADSDLGVLLGAKCMAYDATTAHTLTASATGTSLTVTVP